LPAIPIVFSEAAMRSSLNNHWGCVCAKNGFFKFMTTLCCKKGSHILSWLWMETYKLAPLLLCLKGFPSSLLRLSKYVADLWVLTAGSSPLYETKPPPIDTQACSGTAGLVSEKENFGVICHQIYCKLAHVLTENKLRSPRLWKRGSTPGNGKV
jgi:hypothetical protein